MILEVKDITVRYGAITALRDVSLSVAGREIVTVIGSNGAGKSSLLNAIVGIVPVANGAILLDALKLNGLPSYRLVGMGLGYVPEGRELFGPMSVLDNLILGAYSDRHRKGWEVLANVNWFIRNQKVNQTLAYVFSLFPRLEERQKQRAESLSGGEQQMLAIGRALMSKPGLLLLDEPSLGLAPIIVREILGLLTRLRDDGMGILLVEQDAVSSLRIADRAVVLERGHIIIQGEAKDIIKDDRVRQAYLGKIVA
ncbi:MAG: ABC transporter ATP-binding protein [Chloroflexota bacterium]